MGGKGVGGRVALGVCDRECWRICECVSVVFTIIGANAGNGGNKKVLPRNHKGILRTLEN